MISLTALVLTYNEQENIRRNLEALVWVPRVLIVYDRIEKADLIPGAWRLGAFA